MWGHFILSYYKALGGVSTMAEYMENSTLTDLNEMKIDILNEQYGDQLIECFMAIRDNLVNDYSDLLGIRVAWDDIVGKSLYGLQGMSSYDVAIKANMSDFTNITSKMEQSLASNEIYDNQAPAVDGESAALPAGTDPQAVAWADYFTAKDSVDGELDMTKAEYTVSDKADFSVPGSYSDAVECRIADAAGNVGSKKIRVTIYNPDNTAAPVVTPKETLPTPLWMRTDLM